MATVLIKYIAGGLWGRIGPGGKWHWAACSVAGELTLQCPSDAEMCYYKRIELNIVGAHRDELNAAMAALPETEEGGPLVRPWLDKMLGGLAAPHGLAAPFSFDEEGRRLVTVLPSFWQLLRSLEAEGRDFAVVLRTFGTDGPRVMRAMAAFAAGGHPDHPNGCLAALPAEPPHVQLIRGADSSMSLRLPDGGGCGRVLADGEAAVLEHLDEVRGSIAVRDDFPAWRAGDFAAAAGKPHWLERPVTEAKPVRDESAPILHRIMFDDHFRPDAPGDSIIDVRACGCGPDGPWLSGSVDPRIAAEAGCAVQAELHRAILEVDYFVELVRRCERLWRHGRGAS